MRERTARVSSFNEHAISNAMAAVQTGAEVSLDKVSKSFGGLKAVDNINLTLRAGSFVTLLGPSGSGKTTTLNLIAGFLMPDSGAIHFDSVSVSGVPPHRRDIGMVFQSYALFPHMSVFENVAYPLRMRSKLERLELRHRVDEALALVKLSGLEARYPRQLSGGQQQRVAMARALVSRPRLLLMDEPLGALDKKLREQLQMEMKYIHKQIGSTFLYVTHDQSEALTMSDLVVVMRRGQIAQIGAPRDLYERPADMFVADFLGGANLLPAKIVNADQCSCAVRLANDVVVRVPARDISYLPEQKVCVFIRPEDVEVSPLPAPGNGILNGQILEVLYLGEALRVLVAVGPMLITARTPRHLRGLSSGTDVHLSWASQNARILLPDANE
jgi:spermidine/putrescine ABC transporter ATP-binding subunit